MTYVVAGVSGNTGKVAANTLLDAGKKVRVLVRDKARGEAFAARGAEVAVADLKDAKAVAAAFAGAEGAYVLVPPNMAPGFRAYQDAVSDALASAIKTSNIPHVVLLSSVGAELPSGTGPIQGLHYTEKLFREVGGTSKFSFLRAGYFMENLATSLSMLGQGVVTTFTPADLAIEMIATQDIGKLAAELLLEGAKETSVVELGGPPRTMNDVAKVLSKLTGNTISVKEFPVEAMVPTLTSFGVPEEVAALYQEMTAAFIAGRVKFHGTDRRVIGKTELETVLAPLLKK